MGGLEPGQGLVEEPITFALPLPITGRALEVEDAAVHDLGPHPWTGAWVEMTLFAEDGAGQRSVAGPVTLRLPGRYFTHELARSLVEQPPRTGDGLRTGGPGAGRPAIGDPAAGGGLRRQSRRLSGRAHGDPPAGGWGRDRSGLEGGGGSGGVSVAGRAVARRRRLVQRVGAVARRRGGAAPGAGERHRRGHPPRHGRAARRDAGIYPGNDPPGAGAGAAAR